MQEYEAFKKIIVNDYPYEKTINDEYFYSVFKKIYAEIVDEHSNIQNNYYSRNGKGILNLLYLDHFLILCHRLSNYIYNEGLERHLSDAIYYSSRIRTSTDIFYRAKIGKYFMPSHPLGTVIDSHSTYGMCFKLYNNVHIGPYDILGKESSEWKHPKFGDGVTILGGASVFGNTVIGDNVIISVKSTLINEQIPSNCIVTGISPNIVVIPNPHDNLSIIKNNRC